MNPIKPLARTRDTITLKRADFDALVRSAEDAVDLAAVDTHRAYEDRIGWETARRNYLTVDEARRLLDGESPVRIWRVKRGIKQRTLAEAAEVAVSYLAEIEGGKKPGSSGALQRIASALEMPLEPLINAGKPSPSLQPVSRSETAAKRLVALAESEANGKRVAGDACAIVDEWRAVAEQREVPHQVRAAIEALIARVAEAWTEREGEANERERDGDERGETHKRSASRALKAAHDQLCDLRDAR